MQTEFAVDRADFGRPDQASMGDRDRMQRSLERLQPEGQKAVEHWKSRAEVVVLPDIGLQQGRMIGKPIEDLRRGQTIAFELAAEVPGCQFFGGPLRCHDVLRFGHRVCYSPPAQTSTKNK